MIAALALTLALATSNAAPASRPLAQPPSERARQQALPQSGDPLWRLFARSQIIGDAAKGVFTARHPPEVKALDGKPILISGYMLKTDVMSNFNSFILSRYTIVCPFCPPGAPNEAAEIDLKRFITRPTDGPVTVSGVLHVHADGATGLFFSIDHAELVEAPKWGPETSPML